MEDVALEEEVVCGFGFVLAFDLILWRKTFNLLWPVRICTRVWWSWMDFRIPAAFGVGKRRFVTWARSIGLHSVFHNSSKYLSILWRAIFWLSFVGSMPHVFRICCIIQDFLVLLFESAFRRAMNSILLWLPWRTRFGQRVTFAAPG